MNLKPSCTDDAVAAAKARQALDAATLMPRPETIAVSSVRSCFGDYELLEEVARGGLGIVYRARQSSLNRIVALKMLLSGNNASEEERLRFQSEAEAAAHLSHPGIVPIFDVGECEGHLYFSMAYVPGDNLAERIAAGPLPPTAAAELLKQVAEAVSYAHEHGIIHRDIKPANILLAEEDRPLVTDFGIAKIHSNQADLTEAGKILGTPNYMPPEQANGDMQLVDVRSDVYSLGSVLYAALTGRPPFQAATSLETIMQVLEHDPVSPRQLNWEVSRELNTITMKCLEKDPKRRYATASELAEDLGRFLAGEPISARPRSRLELALHWYRSNLLAASVSGTAALSLMGVAFAITLAYAGEVSTRRQLEQQLTELEEQLQSADVQVDIERSVRKAAMTRDN